MTLHVRGARSTAAAEKVVRGDLLRMAASTVVRFCSDTTAILDMEVRKLWHDPLEVFTRAVQPVLWLVIFGKVMAATHAIPTGTLSYEDFLAPGILAQSTMFVAIFFGIALIWERDLGVLNKFLVSPASRAALVTGKAASAGVRALVQGLIVYAVAAALGVDLHLDVLALAGVVAALLIGAALFATFSLVIACLVRTRERFMGLGQLVTMPLFFASNAIYPIAIMPAGLGALARVNPLSYQADALRALMLAHGVSRFGLTTDFGVLAGVFVVLVAVAARLYPRAVL